MSIYLLKSRFQNLLRPLVRRLHQFGISANAVTHAAGVVSLLVAGWVYWQAAQTPIWYALLPVWMLLRMGMNAIDGMLAREFGHASRLGAYLNELWDVLADAALYASLASLAALQPAPTLAVVSGLYELFPDNALLEASLSGLARAVPAGGYLAYTGQPWHPQLAFIARALTSHRDGEAWVMRRRSQAEMDELVRQAGFKKVTQRIDDFGIFTVSLAQREG